MSGAAASGLPPQFLSAGSRVAAEVILEPAPVARNRSIAGDGVDLTCDVRPGHTAVLAVRLPSGALMFHRPAPASARAAGTPTTVRFHVTVGVPATRGVVGYAVRAIVIEVAKFSADKAVSFALPKLAEAYERAAWKKRGLKEGWVRVTREALTAGLLPAGAPLSPARSLLFLHGPFSNAAAAFRPLGSSDFFDRVRAAYGDRIFAFDHLSISRTPEQNARMLLEALPEKTTTFDVVAHSRGGLVLRTLVERAAHIGEHARRFKVGRAVLVACPNEGTPLATPRRWEETVGWLANLLEMLPDEPITTGASFVANGLVWLANHAAGDLPGLHAMDRDGGLPAALRNSPGPPPDAYSALVANYHPKSETVRRLIDAGIDRFFATANDLFVPSEGGWRIAGDAGAFVPTSRVGCFGPGGNLPGDSVTHNGFFSQPATVDFLVKGLLGRPQNLESIDIGQNLPDRRMLRGTDVPDVPGAGRARVRKGERRVDRRLALGKNAPLRITVTNGDLTYVAEPLLIGHYRSSKLTGAEAVMDRAIGDAMGASLARGLYPTTAGTHQIFVNTKQNAENPWQLPRPVAVIVAGLGAEGDLRGSDLVNTVRQAVIAWGQRLTERETVPPAFSLATTLLGSGGAGISAGQAAQLIAQGVREANDEMSTGRTDLRPWPCVADLHIIELYLDRATEAWRSLQELVNASPTFYQVTPVIEQGIGALRRPPDGGYRGAEYDFISALVEKTDEQGERIVYTIDTKRARSEARAQATQLPLIRGLVATASNSAGADSQIGRTLFSLLVPVDLEPFMGSSAATVIQVDNGTAGIPWELLDSVVPGSADTRPWAIRTKLLRKLRTETPARSVSDASADDSVLIIGDPACDRERYAKLFGARREALAVAECLGARANGAETEQPALVPHVAALISPPDYEGTEPDANDVINATMSRAWRIIHIAGHGELPLGTGPALAPRGVVLSNGSYLGPTEIGALRVIPELVFVNCCHLASADEALLLKEMHYDRAQFASGVAEALIKAGVRCIVAAGWAIDDEAARVFATTFYERLLAGARFIDAVVAARAAARDVGGNTWAAYQCYGDPDWQYRRGTGDAQRPSLPPSEEFAGIPSVVALVLTLETLAVKSEFQNADAAEQATRLDFLERSTERLWMASGQVAEAFGNAWAKAGNFEKAILWYERARTAPDGTASLAALEQLANLKVRQACEEMTSQNAGDRARLQSARREIAGAMALLDNLLVVGATIERESLYGSAYKRLAMIEGAAGREDKEIDAIAQMKEHYKAAEDIARASMAENGTASTNLYYPAMNRIAAELALEAGTSRVASLDAETLAVIRQSMLAAPVNFWSVVGLTELKLYASISAGTLEKDVSRLTDDFSEHHSRVSSPRMWASVLDNACFVLLKYKKRAGHREARAADRLLEHLAALAARPARQSNSGKNRGTSRPTSKRRARS